MDKPSHPPAQPSLFNSDDHCHAPKAPKALSPDEQQLVHAYQVIDRPLDDLPYTQAFEAEILGLDRGAGHLTAEQRAHAHASLHTLQRLRKSGRLPRVTGKSSALLPLTPEDAGTLERLVLSEIDTLGQRDRLPYTPAMDRIVERFNAESGLACDHHAVWRKIAWLAK